MKSITIDYDTTTALPLDLELLKSDLRISGDALDEVLSAQYIPASLAWFESETKRSLLTRTHRWIVDAFPVADQGWAFKLPRGVVSAVTSIIYSLDGSDVTLTGPSSGSPTGTDYQEDLSGHVARIMPPRGETWPEADSDVPQPVKITYSAGWSSDKVIPEDIKRGLVAYIYGAMELDGLLQIRSGFDEDFASKLISPYRSVDV